MELKKGIQVKIIAGKDKGKTGEILEFVDKDIEELQKKVAEKLGYKLVDHKLELYAQKIKKN